MLLKNGKNQEDQSKAQKISFIQNQYKEAGETLLNTNLALLPQEELALLGHLTPALEEKPQLYPGVNLYKKKLLSLLNRQSKTSNPLKNVLLLTNSEEKLDGTTKDERNIVYDTAVEDAINLRAG